MSNLQLNNRLQSGHLLFTAARLQNGGLAPRQGLTFAGQWGAVLIGPDISLPAGRTINPPVAKGPLWSTLAGGGRPNMTFRQDINHDWKRGHLVNGDWSGPGQWVNMTPLTPSDNTNHKTVEEHMRNFCLASLAYDTTGPYKLDWYGIAYLVQCSTVPWSALPANADLYSYCPAFIKVSWRAVQIPKPNNIPTNRIQTYLNSYVGFPTVAVLPFRAPARPIAITGPCVPALGNAPGGAVFPYGGYPVAQGNGFDGQIEIHQD